MQKILSVSEMKRSFPSEWLLLSDPETDESLEVIKGKMLFHSKDRDEVYREAIRLQPRRFATVYTGQIPRDAAVVL